MKRLLISLLALLLSFGPMAAQERRDTLEASRISVMREKTRNTTQTGLMHIDSKQLNSGVAVFGTPDLIKKLQMLPGVAAGNELMSGLYVHGGDGNDNLFLLDGVPLYNISHFGGLFSSFNTDVIDNLDFYKSGFPARYGGRMSSVVDVETREGDMEHFHGTVSLGLIDGRLQFEGPIVKNKTSFNLGLRRSWMDLVLIPALWYANRRNGEDQTASGAYAMSDINARLTHRFAPGNVLNLTFYTGSDRLRAGLDETNREKDEQGRLHEGNSTMKMDVQWGSLTAAANHQYQFSKKLKAKSSIYYSQSTSNTGYQFGFWNWADDKESITAMDDNDRSYVREVGLYSNWEWTPNNYHRIRYGVSAQYHWYHSGRSFASSTVTGGITERESGDSEEQGYRSLEPAIYAEDEIFLRYNLTLNAGFRYALFATPGKVWHSPEPRLAFKWLITPDVSAKLSYTRMSQFAHLVAALYMDLPSNCWMPSTASARPMNSDQIAGGIYTTPFKNFKFNLEGWYKTMNHILVYNGSNTFIPPVTEWEKTFTEGRGQSWGMEVEATYDNGPLSLSAYYTLSWTRRNFEAIYSDWYPDRNDNRHKLNLVASWHFAKHWELFANWNFHSGNRITFPSHYIEKDGQRIYLYDAPYNTLLPHYHRLDLGIDYGTTFRSGHSLRVNLSIYNAYNHLNASLAFLRTNADGSFSGMAYGLIPIIPTLTATYKF
ncbi:MAG: TonB-dependent receptor plug domain-containing protein [Bacteroidales bacterium]|nr:TonB-dependent receptor plug domain-containing protein [Bacteroidales bacterium]